MLALTAFAQIGALASADPAAHSAEVSCAWSHSIGYFRASATRGPQWRGVGEWMRARKRVALGLGDPAVADRFPTWGLSGAPTTAALASFPPKAYTKWVRIRSAAG